VAQHWAHDRARDRIGRICGSASDEVRDERALRSVVLTELAGAIGFDAYVWLLTDPVTSVGCAPLADVPCLPQLPTLIRLKYLTTVNRWTGLLPPAAPVGLLVRDTAGHREHSKVWRLLLRDLGCGDIASTVFADRHGCWGFLDLWRLGDEPFSDADADLLAAVAGPVCRAVRDRQARAFAAADAARSPDPPAAAAGPAVLIVDDELRITARTTAAADWLRSLLPTAAGRDPVPAAVYNVAAQLLAREAGVDEHPAAATTSVGGRTWVTLRASRLEPADGNRPGTIAVSIEEATAASRLDLFGRCNGLSARERELVALVVAGSDTADIAHSMSIAEYTVQDHLKSVFAKTGVGSRGALITTAIGPRQGG
jgi:DNA-binding CsgD family transcriptional regulator